ncbi:MAG: ATP-dependent zinc metalloprotease FtsH, partial [Actinomycetota bacterium]|nr:ATP-dependent zinc metalloprotease FtsH [Actinomycetota bacterium]
MTTRTRPHNAPPSTDKDPRRPALLLCVLALPVLMATYALILGYWARPESSGRQLRIDQFVALVENGEVDSATILSADDRILGTYGGGQRYWVDFSGGHETLFARLTGALDAAKVPTAVRAQPLKGVVGPLTTMLPVLILGDIFVILFLATKSANPLGTFGRAGARGVDDAQQTLTFTEVAGADEAVEELREIADYLSHPDRFAAIGAAVPKGVLLSGPPGCGKTRLARAVAGEAAVPFFSISGSDFVEMYVGVGAARIRDLFAQVRAAAPAIVFIDEIDAVGRARSASAAGGSDERETTLNQLLVEMDGFGAESGVVVMAATNRPDILDAALLRPGRFDRRVTIDPPDRRGREAILAIHTRGKPLAAGVDLPSVARSTAGFSGADLANVVNEAALMAARRSSQSIDGTDFAEAVERVVSGPSRRSRILTPGDRRRIAVHESGHAVVAAALPAAAPVTKVSVLARGHAGGSTLQVPEGDRVLATRSELAGRLAVLMGGWAAERMCFGEASTGSNDDLVRATDLARRMVWECGMGERFGPVAIAPANLAGDGSVPAWSETTVAAIDAETRAIVGTARDRAVG